VGLPQNCLQLRFELFLCICLQLQIQYTQTTPKNVKSYLERTPHYSFWADWKKKGNRAFEIRRDREDTPFWKGAETITDNYSNNNVKDEVASVFEIERLLPVDQK